jgi:hypothetical protein
MILGLGGVLAYPGLSVSQPTGSVLAAQEGVTDDPTTTLTVTVSEPGTQEISGNISSRAGSVLFIGEDSIEKTIMLNVTRPLIVFVETNWTNRETDIDVYLYRVGETDPTILAEPNVFNSAASPLGAAAFPENIGPNVLLPGRYVIGVSNFECDTCGANDTPIDNPMTAYSVRITAAESGPVEVNVDNGILGILRFRTGLGRTYVTRFSLGEQLGLEAPRSVTVTGARVLLFNPSTFGVGRPDIPGQSVRFIAFTAPAGTATPPNNPTLVLDRNLTVPGSDGYIDFAFDPPLTVDSNVELFVGYFVADPANNGMQFNIEVANPSGRSFFTGGIGTSTAVLAGWAPDEGTATASPGGNLMLRLLATR